MVVQDPGVLSYALFTNKLFGKNIVPVLDSLRVSITSNLGPCRNILQVMYGASQGPFFAARPPVSAGSGQSAHRESQSRSCLASVLSRLGKGLFQAVRQSLMTQ